MKTKYPSMFGLLAALLLVASFVIPVNLVSPAKVQADPGICKWDILLTPGALPLASDLSLTTDLIDMAVGGDAKTVLLNRRYYISAALVALLGYPAGLAGPRSMVAWSSNAGMTFTTSKVLNLWRDMGCLSAAPGVVRPYIT